MYSTERRQRWDEHEYGRERKWEEKLQRISSGCLRFLSLLFGINRLWPVLLFLVDAMTELQEHELDEYGRERKLDEILQRITLRCLQFLKLFFSINTAWFVLLFLGNIVAPDGRNGKLSSDEALEVFLAGATFAGIT
jgi:hypothetical protein